MIEALILALTFFAGGLIGAIFFGGLWWTIRQGVLSERPALWFLGSLLLRTGISLGGFYFVSGDQWQRWLFCLSGFVGARFAVSWLTRISFEDRFRFNRKARHAANA
jgi:F1F0 ATPase subunit 2